ncbi:MAG: exodeoxyribonuclease VII large subunit [Clostridia bacterium]|nr:exodeoxyribonuclease VII large subunit [Clostridia bacterium]
MKVSVSQLNAYVKQSLAADAILSDIVVSGEISGLKMHSSGHIYFTLKDESAAIRCAFFKPHSLRLAIKLQDGMRVLARGKVSLYERDGQYQLNVFEVTADGEGLLYQQFEKLKKQLLEEGLFDEQFKKPIPKFVKKIGVATSPTGAVIRDIINVSTRRCPNISIVLAPVSVQGPDAPRSICAGLDALDKMDDVDVIIVGRGGGSMEDLWCFNDESVARKIFACTKPVISAVGHETDFTIADFVSDLRAPTPSAAAELAVFDYYRVLGDIEHFSLALGRQLENAISANYLRLSKLSAKIESPENALSGYEHKLELLKQRLFEGAKREDEENKLSIFAGKLDALSPLKVLERGYSVTVDKDGRIIKDASKTKKGDRISVRVRKGIINAEVLDNE